MLLARPISEEELIIIAIGYMKYVSNLEALKGVLFSKG